MRNTTTERAVPAGLEAQLLGLMEQRQVPGMQVAVVRNDDIALLEAFGVANVEHRVPVTHDSVFSINSMAKAFTGVALMQLVEAGQLDLDATAASYLDDLPAPWSTITVRQLATMRSGLPDIMAYRADNSVYLIGDRDEETAWAEVYALPLEFPPGQGYQYSQTNYALLGRIIDHLSGRPFTEFITERQFAVADMPRTRYANDSDIIPDRADTYMSISAQGDPLGTIDKSRLDWPPVLRTAAGLHSTARDLARWLIALRRGRLLEQASSLDELWRPTPHHDGRPGIWGIGWLVSRTARGQVPAPGGGGKAQIALYPDGTSVIVLTNLLGAFTEHLAVVDGDPINLVAINGIADFYAFGRTP